MMMKMHNHVVDLFRLVPRTLVIAGAIVSQCLFQSFSGAAAGSAAVRKVGGETSTVRPAAVVSWEEMIINDAVVIPTHTPDLFATATVLMPGPPLELEGFASPQQKAASKTMYAETVPHLHRSHTTHEQPTLVRSFPALEYDRLFIPPDTMGAAGPNHLMVMLNTQVRIQSKTGDDLSTVSTRGFWTSSSGFIGVPFDPRLIYDPLSGRWMAVVDVNPYWSSDPAFVWFAISATDDPTGNWTFFEFDPDPTDTYWADFPDIGTNSTWIAITNNIYTYEKEFVGTMMWVIDKSTALAGGTLTVTTFPLDFDVDPIYNTRGASLRPALTFDADQSTLYIADSRGYHYPNDHYPVIRLSQIIGSGSAPEWLVVPGGVWPGAGFFKVNIPFERQQINASQLGTMTRVETNDQRLLNAVFRNGHLWTTHSGGLPFDGDQNTQNADRTTVFWYELDPVLMPATGNPIIQSGVIAGDSEVHHFFPSIAVNTSNEVLISFSRSDPTRYVEAVFTGRRPGDAPGTIGPIQVLKPGEDSYEKQREGKVRWGDYSATVVDPVGQVDFWTIQEYAEEDVGPDSDDDRWGTWWGLVSFRYDHRVYLPMLNR